MFAGRDRVQYRTSEMLMGLTGTGLTASRKFLGLGGLFRGGFTDWGSEGSLLRQSLSRRAAAVDDVVGDGFGLLAIGRLFGSRLSDWVIRVSTRWLPAIFGKVVAFSDWLLALSAGAVLSAAACTRANPLLHLVDIAEEHGAVRLGIRVIANGLPVNVGRVTFLFLTVAVEVLSSLTGLQAVNQSLVEGVIRRVGHWLAVVASNLSQLGLGTLTDSNHQQQCHQACLQLHFPGSFHRAVT